MKRWEERREEGGGGGEGDGAPVARLNSGLFTAVGGKTNSALIRMIRMSMIRTSDALRHRPTFLLFIAGEVEALGSLAPRPTPFVFQ